MTTDAGSMKDLTKKIIEERVTRDELSMILRGSIRGRAASRP
jgi:hypothetical protein